MYGNTVTLGEVQQVDQHRRMANALVLSAVSSTAESSLIGLDKDLMEQWIRLPSRKWMMYFYNDRAELCVEGSCKPIDGRNALNAGLATR